MWAGQAFSLAGSNIAQFALVWWLTANTGSATVLAGATLVAILPQVILGPFAGALVDRWNRRMVMICSDAFIALVSLWLAILFWKGSAGMVHIYLAMFARSIGDAFHWPSMQASTTLMVPKKHLSRIAGLNQTLRGAMRIGSPPLGALLLQVMPMQSIMGIDVVTAILAITPLFFILIPQPAKLSKAKEAGGTLIKEMVDGFKFIWAWPGLKGVILMAMAIALIVDPAFSLMPLFVTEHLKGDAVQLGWLESAWGMGMVTGGLLLSVWGGFKKQVFTSLGGLVLQGLFITLFGFSTQNIFWFSLATLFAAGSMNPMVNGPFIAILQSTVPPDIQGRVLMLVQSLTVAMMPLGLAVAGPVADLIGVQTWIIVAGVVSALLGAGCMFVPAIVNIDSNNKNGRDRSKVLSSVHTD
jgi:DHA3 family macrolide efflux protein-like MFS transporter